MPHVLLHVTAVRLLEGEEHLHPLGREAIRRRRDLAYLGAMLADLPRFGGGPAAHALSALAGRDVPPNPWRDRLHHEKGIAVGLTLLAAHEGLGPLARLALALGYMSHAALDSALHPLVHRLARRDANGVPEPRLHQRIEKYQALAAHPRLTGVELPADDTTWRAVDLSAFPHVPRALDWAGDAVRRARGQGPTPHEWRGFLTGLGHWVRWARGRLDKVDGGAADPAEARRRWVEDAGFFEELVRAQARAVVWCNRLALCFERADVDPAELERLRAEFREVDLDTDGDLLADHAWGPELAAQGAHMAAWSAEADRYKAADHSAMSSHAESVLSRDATPPEDTIMPSDDDVQDEPLADFPAGGPLPGTFAELDVAGPPPTPETTPPPSDDALRPRGRTPR